MGHKKIFTTHGPMMADEDDGAILMKLPAGSDAAAEYAAGLRLATTGGTVEFGALPTDGETITIGGAAEAINDTYTFLDVLLGAANEVHIETTRDATMANLVAAINLNTPDVVDSAGIEIADPDQGVAATLRVWPFPDNDTLTLEPTARGASGNLTLADSSAQITVVSLSGGADFNTVTLEAMVVAMKNGDEKREKAYRFATGASALLITGMAEAFHANLTSIMIYPHDPDVPTYTNDGAAASATTEKVPARGVHYACDKTLADTIQIFSAGDFVTVYTFVPRNG